MVKESKVEKLTREQELNFQFDQALNDPHTRIEFIRKGKGSQPRQKIGVMIACIDPMDEDKAIIGFSLCHAQLDDFDFINWGFHEKKNHGKKIAHRRAIKWCDCVESFIYSKKLEENFRETVYIPQTVHESLANFVFNCYKYYRDKEFPTWVENYFPKEDAKEVETETAG